MRILFVAAALSVVACGGGGSEGGVPDGGGPADAAPIDAAPCDPDAFPRHCDDQHELHVCQGGLEQVGLLCPAGNACLGFTDDSGAPGYYCVDPSLTPCDVASYPRCDDDRVVWCESLDGQHGYTLTSACCDPNPVCKGANGRAGCTYAGATECSTIGFYCDPADPARLYDCYVGHYPIRSDCAPPSPSNPCSCGAFPSGDIACFPASGPSYLCGLVDSSVCPGP